MINKKINIKSRKSDIESEITLLKAHIKSTNKIDTIKIQKRVLMLEAELTHRISGYKKPVRILQGGSVGSKK